MALRKTFHIFDLEDDNEAVRQYIWLHDFADFLQTQYKSPPDKKKELQPAKILKTLETYDVHEKIQEIDYHVERIKLKKKAVPVLCVAKYVFQNAGSLTSCTKLAEAIIQEDIKGGTYQNSLLEFYTHLTAYNLPVLSELISLTESDIPSMNTAALDYKKQFREEQWQTILLFEYHFQKQCQSKDSECTLDESVQARWAYFSICKNATELGEKFMDSSKALVNERDERKKIGIKQQGIQISGSQSHLPSILDAAIKEAINNHLDRFSNAISVDIETSRATNSIHVYLELAKDREWMPDNGDMSLQRCIKKVLNDHSINLGSLVLFEHGVFGRFCDMGDSVSRFNLRDSFLAGKLDGTVKLSHTFTDTSAYDFHEDDADDSGSDKQCPMCFGYSSLQPLLYNQFDTVEEWIQGVPLPMQLLLRSFLKKI